MQNALQTLSVERNMEADITIDGSYGEGGGQIIRNACTYAAILQKNIRITNIRTGRKTPGLRPQHLVGLRLLAEASGSSLAEGNHVASTEILFLGSNRSNTTASKSGEYVGDTKTAGAICLLMQTVLPFALFRGCCDDGNDDDELVKFILKGGTDVAFAPPLDYNRYIFFPVLYNFGVAELKHFIDLSLVTRGFYPRGGGEVHLSIRHLSSNSLPFPPIRLTERGNIVRITIHAFASGKCPVSMAQTLASTVQKLISSNPRYNTIPISMEVNRGATSTDPFERDQKKIRSSGSGCGVVITAKTDTGCVLGGSATGSPKIQLEETARLATREVIEAMDSGGCVDKYLQDQLIIYMALAGGVSEILCDSLTMHTETAIWLASRMLSSVRFEVTKVESPGEADASPHDGISSCYRIRCHGIGFCPSIDQIA